MAIDYKKEWEKLKKTFGSNAIIYSGHKGMPTLGDLMESQIKTVINSREKLMKEYIKEELETDITGGGKIGHIVNVTTRGIAFGNIVVSKKDFAKWCEKKGGK